MSRAGIALVSVLGGLAFVVLLGWFTWNFVFDRMDQVMVLMFLDTFTGAGSLGGQ